MIELSGLKESRRRGGGNLVRKALALLVGIAVLGVALGIVGLLWPGIADAQTPGGHQDHHADDGGSRW